MQSGEDNKKSNRMEARKSKMKTDEYIKDGVAKCEELESDCSYSEII